VLIWLTRSRLRDITRDAPPVAESISWLSNWRVAENASRRTRCGSFATHLREQNIDMRVIQVLSAVGGQFWASASSRCREAADISQARHHRAPYSHVAINVIREVMSPLDRLTPLVPKRTDAPPADVGGPAL
jgi:hypothetical protein